MFLDPISCSLLLTQIDNIYKCYASTPISVCGDGIWVKGGLVGRQKWWDWLMWQMALFFCGYRDNMILRSNRQAVGHLGHTLIGAEWVRCLAWLRNIKGEWKVGFWDSVLPALNHAKYNFSLSLILCNATQYAGNTHAF